MRITMRWHTLSKMIERVKPTGNFFVSIKVGGPDGWDTIPRPPWSTPGTTYSVSPASIPARLDVAPHEAPSAASATRLRVFLLNSTATR